MEPASVPPAATESGRLKITPDAYKKNSSHHRSKPQPLAGVPPTMFESNTFTFPLDQLTDVCKALPLFESNTCSFPLDQFTDVGEALLLFAQYQPALFGLSFVAITAGLVTITVPVAIGFSTVGTVAGKLNRCSSYVARMLTGWWCRYGGGRVAGVSWQGRFLRPCSR